MKKKKPTKRDSGAGVNRTGIMTAPDLARELLEGVEQFSPEPNLNVSSGAAIRADSIREGIHLGSLPPAGEQMMSILLDKVGARLAFERSGVRLYNLLIQKHAALNAAGAPERSDLQHIRDEEMAHMTMLEGWLIELGGDPTMLTPAANVNAVISSGAFKVVADPRTSIAQCLDAILTAELVDNDSWTVLTDMLREHGGMDEFVTDCETALEEENEHLEMVRGWIRSDAGLKAA